MMINDIHRHIVYEETNCLSHYTFEKFIQSRSCIVKTAIFLHPQYKRLYPCPDGHRCRVIDVDNGIKFECKTCGKIIYEGPDPYREGNIKLINLCKGHSKLFPFIYLTLSNNTMESEINYFETNFKSHFYGIKVHPNLCSRKMSDIKFKSKYPLIIHCGMTEYDDPLDIVQYAKGYPGKVILAHLARCKESVLKDIANSDNIYIDTSPTYLPFQIAEQSTKRYFHSDVTNINNVTHFFENLIKIVGEKKIIFGTDIPWGSDEEALKLYNDLALPEQQKRFIFKCNFENIINETIH